MKRLLVVVDMQNDFVSGALGSGRARKIVSAVCGLIAKERAAGTDVVFTQDTHGADYLQSQEGKLLPVKHCVRGTEGWKLIPELTPSAEGAKVFEKDTFGSTGVASFARSGGYGEILLCGVCTDICVIGNAFLLKAYCPEAVVRVCAAACAGSSPAGHRDALKAMKRSQIYID